MCNDSQICLLNGNSSLRVHHCEHVAKDVFPHVHYFAFIETDFHLPFYYPVTWFLNSLCKPSQTVLAWSAVNTVMSAAGYANSLFISSPRRLFRGVRCLRDHTNHLHFVRSPACPASRWYHVTFPFFSCRPVFIHNFSPYSNSLGSPPEPGLPALVERGDARATACFPPRSSEEAPAAPGAGAALAARRLPGARLGAARRAQPDRQSAGPPVRTAPSGGCGRHGCPAPPPGASARGSAAAPLGVS